MFDQSGSRTFNQKAFNLFGYDELGSAISAQRYKGGDVSSPELRVAEQQYGFTYDSIGNRLTATDGVLGTFYTPNNLKSVQYGSGWFPVSPSLWLMMKMGI